MPPKKRAGVTPSVIDFWGSMKTQPKQQKMDFRPNEIIDISESQEENEQPGPSVEAKKIVRRTSSSARRAIPTVMSDSDLREVGCDVEELKVIEVSVDVECIEEDINLVRKLISSNVVLAFPIRSIFILSMYIKNWLRIFPTGRMCICTSEQDWIEGLIEECELNGIDRTSFFTLKLSKIPPTSRLMFASGKILQRLISSDPLASQISSVVFHMSGPNTPSNLKSAVNEMLMKKISCRFIAIGGGGSCGGRAKAISRRQSIITTLNMSDFIEPSEDSFCSVIKPPLHYPVAVSPWTETDNPFLVEAINQLEEAIMDIVNVNEVDKGLVGIYPMDLIYAPLNILSDSRAMDDYLRLISLLYHLFSYGKEAFDRRLAELASESGDLEMRLLSSQSFTRVLATVSELEGTEHRKMSLIKEIIHRSRKDGSIKALILVDSPSLVESVSSCISLMCGVLKVNVYPLGSPRFPLSHASTLLQSGGVAILSVHDQAGVHAFHNIVCSPLPLLISTSRRSVINVENTSTICEWVFILHESREKIRGMIEVEREQYTHERMESAFTLQNYPFNYERNVLSLDTSCASIRLSTEKNKVYKWNGVSLNPTERSLLCTRSLSWMGSLLPLTLTHSSLLWNDSIHSSHPSSLSHRLVSTIAPFTPPLPPLIALSPPPHPPPLLPPVCQCTSSDGESFYSLLISKLSLFS